MTRLLLPAALLFLFLPPHPAQAQAEATSLVSVTDLRCEYLIDPLGIDTAIPRFTWKLEDPAATRGQKQTAYEVQVTVVASDRAEMSGSTPAWNSGKVSSGQSVNVEYAGQPLTSGQVCHWRVRVWDKDDKPTAWSDSARFSVGLLDPADWKGEWIRLAEADEADHIWYRKNFELDHRPDTALAYVCSISYHELYVNGERVDTRVLSPTVTNLEKRAHYITYDIKPHLRKGDNVLAIWQGPGWARADGSYGKGVWKQDAIVKCQVNLSSGQSLHTDASWKAKVSSSRNLGLWKGGGQGEYGGEIIDARRHLPDWNQPGYDDSRWATPSTYEKQLILSAEMLEPDRKVETIKPVSLKKNGNVWTYDMGRNFTGWLEFDLRHGKEGEVVKFFTSNQPGVVMDFKQESHYIHDVGGEGTFSHRFNWMAGRWISVEGLDYKPSLDDMRGHIITNDRPRIGRFECSKALFNDIYTTDLRTYIANTVNGVTMDCPHRERYGYGEIALACTWGCAIPHMESAAYYAKAARDWYDVQREDGFVNTIAPQVYKGAGGTLWSSAPVTLTWEHYRAYADKRLLEMGYEPMKKWVDFLHGSVSDEGYLTAYTGPSRFLGDWATPHGSEYGHTPAARLFNNGVYAYCLKVMVEAAGILGRDADGKTYSDRLANLRKGAHRHFYNPGSSSYIDGRQLSMAFPLYTGITPEKEREKVLAGFTREITEEKPYLDTGSSGLPILLKFIIEDIDRPELLFTPLTRTELPGYGFFLTHGETTWPEYWDLSHQSRIHTCYTGIGGYFTRGIGGIHPDPEAHGMQQFLLKPSLVGDLTHAHTTSGSLYGEIVSNWSRQGSRGTFEFSIPVNTTATVHIPADKVEDVREGEVAASKAGGVTFLRMENGRAVFRVGSGNYQFTSTSVPEATSEG